MALTECRECGGTVSNQARVCPQCGARVRRSRWWLWVVVPIELMAALLIGLAVSQSPDGQQRNRDHLVIDTCWAEYERKSLTPAEQRFIAGACEQLEEQYRKRHGVKP